MKSWRPGNPRWAALPHDAAFFQDLCDGPLPPEEHAYSHILAPSPDLAAKVQVFRDEHERFGMDLAEFERQMASYHISGDPTVLHSMGDRVIRELKEHIAAEERFTVG